jgi:hypothetical protein
MKRVFIFSKQTPLSREIEGLLCEEPGLEILGWDQNLERAIQRIQEIHPELLIVVDDDLAGVDTKPVAGELLEACGGIRVVQIGLHSNLLRVYGGESRLVKEVKDLLRAIGPSGAG